MPLTTLPVGTFADLLKSPKGQARRFELEQALEASRLQARSRKNSIWDAHDLIRKFIREAYEEHHWDHISITCNLTTVELHDVGRMERSEGIAICRRLVRVPVIHEEVATELWEWLADNQGRKPEEELNDQDLWERRVSEGVAHREAELAEKTGTKNSANVSQPSRSCSLCPDDFSELACAFTQDAVNASKESTSSDATFWKSESRNLPTDSQNTRRESGSSTSSIKSRFSDKVERTKEWVAKMKGQNSYVHPHITKQSAEASKLTSKQNGEPYRSPGHLFPQSGGQTRHVLMGPTEMGVPEIRFWPAPEDNDAYRRFAVLC